MSNFCKRAEDLTITDIAEHPVWEFTNDDTVGETVVRAVSVLPTDNLYGRLVGVKVQLHNRSDAWAILENVDVFDARKNQHFLSISIEKGGKWFHLSRYHDADFATNGPDALARFLDLQINDVFPIYYDVSAYSRGKTDATSGWIHRNPPEQLQADQLVKLALS